MTAMTRTIDLPGRTWLAYREHGDPDGVPVVALHGVTDSLRSFEPLMPYLPRSLRWFSLSQRGHGEAGKPIAGYRPHDFAGDVAAFIDALGLDRVLLVGHSMGSCNALRFALDHPQRLLGLVLAGAAPFFGANPDVASYWRNDIAALADPVDAPFARDFQLSTLAQPVPAGFVDMVTAESMKVPARVWRAAFDGFMSDDFSAELRRIDVPALIVSGAHDTICRDDDARRLHALLTHSRWLRYESAGHAMHWEEPRRFAADVAAFAQRVARDAAATA